MARSQTRHIGLFGGSFNPVHSGHLLAAISIFQQLGLAQVRFLPAAQSPFKERPELSDMHRLAMLECALAPHPGLTVDARELDKASPSYTIDTLKSLALDYPLDTLYLIIGMDAWQEFERWRDWQLIIETCHLVVSSRPGFSAVSLSTDWQARLETNVAKLKASSAGKLIFLGVPASNAASSDIRSRIGQGQSTLGLLPDPVKTYIEAEHLYA